MIEGKLKELEVLRKICDKYPGGEFLKMMQEMGEREEKKDGEGIKMWDKYIK